MIYIHFYHGRKTVDEQLEDWGQDGPIVKCEGITWTYGTLNLLDKDGERAFVRTSEEGDLIPIRGYYYGDFELLEENDDWLHSQIEEGGKILDIEEFIKLNK